MAALPHFAACAHRCFTETNLAGTSGGLQFFLERSVFWIVWNSKNGKTTPAIWNGVPPGGFGVLCKRGHGRRDDAPDAGARGAYRGH